VKEKPFALKNLIADFIQFFLGTRLAISFSQKRGGSKMDQNCECYKHLTQLGKFYACRCCGKIYGPKVDKAKAVDAITWTSHRIALQYGGLDELSK
jgi:hypothetical protein